MSIRSLGPWQVVLAGVFVLVLSLSLVHASGTVSLTVTAVSANTLTIGSPYLWTTTITNNSGSTLSLGNNLLLTYPNGTTFVPGPAATFTSIANGKSSTSSTNNLTTTPYTTATGTYTLQVSTVDKTGKVWATAKTTFAINNLPSSVIPPRFTDLATSSGVGAAEVADFTDCNGLFNMGGGAGWADYDGDGYLDLFVSNFNGSSHLYHNNGGGNLSFTDTTSKAGIPSLTHSTGVSWADYDNDGFPDLLVQTLGQPHLYHNNGNGTFTDVSTQAGITGAGGRGTSTAWGDYDSDGWLDLYVANYGTCNSSGGVQSQADHLFHNNHNGTFTDMTSLLGGTSGPGVLGHGFAAVWFDLNGDNRPDLYVVNDRFDDLALTGNVLWRNDGPGGANGWIFTNISKASATNFVVSGMGVAVGDYNRDGWPDLAFSNVAPNYVLENNSGNGTFTSVAGNLGAQRPYTLSNGKFVNSITWGLGFVDLNNDTWEDLFLVGSSIKQKVVIPHAVLVNNMNGHLTGIPNDGSFLDLTYASGAGNNQLTFNRTAAIADFDADGWMDVFVCPYEGAPQLYRNEGPTDGNTNKWLEVRLIGVSSNRDGVGAKLTLTAGTDTQYRWIFSGTSMGAGTMIPAHFGLAQHSQADTLTIHWPSGAVQTFTNVAANQRIVVTEGSSTLGNDPVPVRQPSP